MCTVGLSHVKDVLVVNIKKGAIKRRASKGADEPPVRETRASKKLKSEQQSPIQEATLTVEGTPTSTLSD